MNIRLNIRFILILLSLSLSSCSLIYSYSDNLPQRIEQLISEKKYNTALNTIDYIKPDHKDFRVVQHKKKQIEKQMHAYERIAIEKSTQLVSQGSWIKALKLLKDVAGNILDETRIIKHQKKILTQRHVVITAYEKEILYKKAESLAENIPLYEKIKKTVSKNEHNQLDISKFDDKREEISLKLAILSEQQYDKTQYNNALNTINLALKLNPDTDTSTRIKETQIRIKEATKKQKASYLKEAKNLLDKLSQGYSHAILGNTKRTIVWLNKNKEDKKNHLTLINKLNKHLSKGVKQRFEAARSLYSKGKTQEALSIWLELKELEPDNVKLLSHIERAEKVLSKFEELSNKPKVVNKK